MEAILKKNKFVILGLIVITILIIFIGLKFFQREEQSNVNYNESPRSFRIVDKDFDKVVDVPFTKISSLRGNGNIVYMSVADNSPSGLNNKIVQYNRKTQKYTTIFESHFKNPSVQGIEINDHWMVWVDCDEWGNYVNPFVMNLNTKEIQPLAKENDDNFLNDFPVLIGNYVAWIQKDVQKDKASIMVKNLQTNEIESIYDLNTYTFRNMLLSATDEKLLFTDEKNNLGYVYLYDVKSKKLKEIKSPYEQIGWARLINNQQWVYLTFEEDSSDNQHLIFYDSLSNSTQEVLSNKDIWFLDKDTKNQVYLRYAESEYLEKYRVEKNKLVKIEKIAVPNIDNFSTKSGIYFLLQNNENKKEIIIQDELTNN